MESWVVRGWVVAALGLSACGRGPGYPSRDEAGTGETGAIPTCEVDPERCISKVTIQRAVDILFVIDNSGSMGEEQGTLASNFAAFIDVLERDAEGVSYRIGVTTSDRRGLRATSCRARLDEFSWMGFLGPQQQSIVSHEQDAGCLSVCQHDDIGLRPTRTEEDSVPRVRPWLEKTREGTNLERGVSLTAALQCIGPQGIGGDGYEAPLESMRDVLLGDADGFLRDDALLAVIFVTDEADCSMPLAHRDRFRFDPIGTEALWSSPDRASSAVCWNAGVQCEGGPGTYASCWAQDKTFAAQPTDDPEEMVLYPVERYVDLLRDIGNEKQRRSGNGTVLVAVIGGVPLDYPDGGELVYRDSEFPDFNLEYGIGPGCGEGTETISDPPGIPPVRLLEVAEAFSTGRRNLFSICSADYAVALRQIAQEIPQLRARACVPGCVKDTSAHVAGLQPQCTVVEERSTVDGGERAIPRCVVTNAGWSFPTEADEVCYRELSDPSGQTAIAHDDMSPQCVTRGANLELVVERREGAPVAAGAAVAVDCQLEHDDPTRTCE